MPPQSRPIFVRNPYPTPSLGLKPSPTALRFNALQLANAFRAITGQRWFFKGERGNGYGDGGSKRRDLPFK